jgi:hypothetical protein
MQSHLLHGDPGLSCPQEAMAISMNWRQSVAGQKSAIDPIIGGSVFRVWKASFMSTMTGPEIYTSVS